MSMAEYLELETNKSKREVVQMGLGTFDLGMGHQICRQTLRGWQDLPHHLTAGVAALALTQQAM